jgi:hypothetical protein
MRCEDCSKEFIMAENYESEERPEDAAFVARIAASLRAQERAHPSFEKRLMDRVRMEGSELYPGLGSARESWWRRERVVRMSPLAGLAAAAGLTAIIALSGLAIGSRIGARTETVARGVAPAAAPDTVQLVRFVFVDTRASTVELVGDFNEWTRGSTALKLSGAPGVWAVSVALTPGRHEYAFIVNGTRWVADPLAVKTSDDFGTESSVIRVAKAGKPEA